MGIKIDVKPKGTSSAYTDGPFDKGLEALKEQGYEIISSEENARLRMQEGYGSEIANNGNWVREGNLYIPKGDIYLLKNGLCLNNPKAATDSHRQGKEYNQLIEQEIETARKTGLKVRKKDLDSSNDIAIPTKRFGSDEYAKFFFGDKAKDYGLWLLNSPRKISQIKIIFDNKNQVNDQSKPYANQFWLHRLGDDSGLNGYDRYLYGSDWVRGVQKASGEATSQKVPTIESYTPNQIAQALTKMGFKGLEKQLIDELGK